MATPDVEVNTAQAYKLLASKKTVPQHQKKDFQENNQQVEYYNTLINDFKPIVFKEYPLIQQLKVKMEAFSPVKVMLSGSGSSLFALFESEANAQKCRASILSVTRFCVVTRFVKK